MHPIDRVDRIFLQNGLLDHQSRPAFIFLGGLKDEMDRPGKISGFSKVLGRSQKHRRVAIVAAGMHTPRISRRMRDLVLLFDVQGIHVGAQCHRTAARHRPLEGADHSRSRDAAFDRDAKGLEELSNQRRRVALFECDPAQTSSLTRLLDAEGLRTRVIRDLAGNDRVVRGDLESPR